MKLPGSPISCSAFSIASTAAPSEPPRATLNEMAMAGNCPRWVINKGPWRWFTWTIADSGTCPLLPDGDDGEENEERLDSARCTDGSASMMTRYWFDLV